MRPDCVPRRAMIRGFGSILEALAAARGIARRIGSPWAPRDASAAARDITRRIGFRAYARPGIVRAQLGRRLPRNSSRIPKLLLPSPARTFDARPDECTPLHEPPAWMADPGRAGSAARSLRDAPRRARSRLVHGSDLPGLRWSARRRRERLPTRRTRDLGTQQRTHGDLALPRRRRPRRRLRSDDPLGRDVHARHDVLLDHERATDGDAIRDRRLRQRAQPRRATGRNPRDPRPESVSHRGERRPPCRR